MQAEVISTGTEILLGYIVNTDAQYLSRELARLGIEVTLHTVVGDDREIMKSALRDALKRVDLVFTTGGLGPTSDDITKEVVAEVLGRPIVLDEESLKAMEAFFAAQGKGLPEAVVRQAYFPAGARVLPNPVGTAPGAIIQVDGKAIVILPGPPRELRAMFTTSVVPYLEALPGRGPVLYVRVYKLTSIPEYAVHDALRDLAATTNPTLGFLARPGEVHVRVTARAGTAEEARKLVDLTGAEIYRRLGEYVFATDDEKIEATVGTLLQKCGLTLSVAESCTAGLLGGRITNVPGSSAYFLGGVIAYSNELKERILGVPRETLDRCGAVSEETAVAMVRGVCALTGADIGLAVTGVAGPGGGTSEKPVGLVYIALAAEQHLDCRRFVLPGHRGAVREGTVNTALNMLKRYLENLSAG
ncbi:MAG: Putative competence-damage inducible protein [Clostridia bacterium 62_21]|nr:MAG: Putative competence-damage inducible protein [Clostridia bacterium 62_21]